MNDIAEQIQEVVKDLQDAEAQLLSEGKKAEAMVVRMVTTQFSVIASELKNLANGI